MRNTKKSITICSGWKATIGCILW